ncbi:MAG: hypothetical protein M1822_006747 [Bathelium mastoideum]|nr:MAG: hypothetical protein M1822_006747 [Bathelium mastoideum]
MANDTPDPEAREAQQYWDYLVKEDKCGTDLLNRLLRGIANHISASVQPDNDCPDLTPAQLAEFYKSVGGDYDALFIDTAPQSISFIYKSLGCVHSLQPSKSGGSYEDPLVPALKPKGFVTWQTVQLLLDPEEHVPFLQNAVKNFDIKDPEKGDVFPKVLPAACLPSKPDEEMLTWYEKVSRHLQADAEEAEQSDRVRLGEREYAHGWKPGPGPISHLSRTESYASMATDDESRSAAAKYFSDPFSRRQNDRPTMMRRYSRDPPHSPPSHHSPHTPRERIMEGGKTVARTVRRTLSPNLWTPRQRSHNHDHSHNHQQRRSSTAEYDDDGEEVAPKGGTPPGRQHSRKYPENRQPPPQAPRPPHHPRPSQHSPPKSPPEEESDSSDTTEDESSQRTPEPRPTSATHPPPSSRHQHHRRSDPPSNRPAQEADSRSQSRHRTSPKASTSAPKPHLRQRRSHDPPSSPREYFAHVQPHHRRSSSSVRPMLNPDSGRRHSHTSTSPGYFPPGASHPPPPTSSASSLVSGSSGGGGGMGGSLHSSYTPAPSMRPPSLVMNSPPGSMPPPPVPTAPLPPNTAPPAAAGLGLYRDSPPPMLHHSSSHAHGGHGRSPGYGGGYGAAPGSGQGYGPQEFTPSASPLFATHVAQLQGGERSGSLPAGFAPSGFVGSGAGGSAGMGGVGGGAGGASGGGGRRGAAPSPLMPAARGPGGYVGRPHSGSGSGGGLGSGGRSSLDDAMLREGMSESPTSSAVGMGSGRRDWYDARGGSGVNPREGGRDWERGERREGWDARREGPVHRYVAPGGMNGVGGRRYPVQGDRY